jgi:hypothetical protein
MNETTTTLKGGTVLKAYAILYSYPTWDPFYRGQRGERIMARNERDAINRIRRGEGRYGKCPDAQIVRCTEVQSNV